MTTKHKVLIVEDHPLIAEAFKTALERVYGVEGVRITHISNLDDYLNNVNSLLVNLDLVFLDINLPINQRGKILSGEDLGIEIRKVSPLTKILVSTTFNDNFRIHNILSNIQPDGFIVKGDVISRDLVAAIESLKEGIPYYSKTVLHLMRKQVGSNFSLDNIDRRLLYELSCGTKMKELPDILPLSIAGVERRKRNLKIIFDVEKEGDGELLRMAKEKGFI